MSGQEPAPNRLMVAERRAARLVGYLIFLQYRRGRLIIGGLCIYVFATMLVN